MSYRLGWATIRVSDMERAVTFYRDTLGMQLRFASADYASFRVGPAMIELTAEPGPIGVSTGIGLGVSDLDATYEELSAKGVRFVAPPAKRPWGDYLAVIVDPDDNELILDHMPHELTEAYLDGRPSGEDGAAP